MQSYYYCSVPVFCLFLSLFTPAYFHDDLIVRCCVFSCDQRRLLLSSRRTTTVLNALHYSNFQSLHDVWVKTYIHQFLLVLVEGQEQNKTERKYKFEVDNNKVLYVPYFVRYYSSIIGIRNQSSVHLSYCVNKKGVALCSCCLLCLGLCLPTKQTEPTFVCVCVCFYIYI